MNKTLFITDLDGTLLDTNACLTERTVSVINSLISKGMIFSYATARSYATSSKVTAGLKLNKPVAVNDGVFIIDPENGEILSSCFMKTEKIRDILNKIVEYNINPLYYSFINGRERVSWIKGRENKGLINYLEARKNDARLNPVDSYEQMFKGDVFYITIIGEKDELGLISPYFNQNPYVDYHIVEDVYNKNEFWLGARRTDANKANALLKIKEITGAKKAVCFGDNINDLPMFNAADESYAVENANIILKNNATAIISSNNDDGVAEWLEKWM